MVATMHTRQKTGAAGATETRKTRHGNEGHTMTSACRRTATEWIQDKMNSAQTEKYVNRLDKETSVEKQELERMGLRIGRQGCEDLAKWVDEHITATMRRGTPTRWKRGWAIWGWLLERVDIQTLPRQDLEMFGQLMAKLGIPARDRRQAPYTQWIRGQKACRPGLSIPGMRAMARPECLALRREQWAIVIDEWEGRARRRMEERHPERGGRGRG